MRNDIAYQAAGWLLTDPDTLLLTGVYAENVTRAQHLALIECELAEADVNKFVDLARRESLAASLSAATNGDLSRSTRWSRVYQPDGYGDEMRGVFSSGGATWGHFCLTRLAEDPFFTDDEVAVMAKVCPHVGNAIRLCLQLGGQPGHGAPGAPALVILADDGSIESMTPQVTEWLGPVEGERMDSAIVLHEVAHQARVLAERGVGEPALARTRARSGDWLVVRAIRLERDGPGTGCTAVVLEQARRADVAPLLVQLRQLTHREKEITQLLVTGMSTREIASRLWITSETLRGHIKAIFAKLGVNSRPALAALLSQELVVRGPQPRA
ncbi:LuxR C-terminal-related transcriptional regulator [Mycolicibacterium celeriflavum]|uniref:helix-turn-helix transcriptional regulator n=1 Tax=Mycolicibacterium celeriflavum TaxID=1249101 RepID=UPI003CF07EF1